MNKEVYHEGWLTKSPPTKRILRARWRRRWFTLKQGELPGQFFLEYYTDRNCRKLKGTIDLDQCEQVDAGLRLDRQKNVEKFQNMFDVKTPHRTYYLAADTEKDMREWVQVICQVCNLQETEDKSDDSSTAVQYCNIGPNGDISIEEQPSPTNDVSNVTDTTMLSSSAPVNDARRLSTRFDSLSVSGGNYENDPHVTSYRHSNYSNRETILFDQRFQQQQQNATNNNGSILEYSNLPTASTMERSHSLKQSHQRNANGAIKKIPESLELKTDKMNNNMDDVVSPALSTCSGPYIPISECFSGSPIIFGNEMPATPLNNLDPRFYDTPRSHAFGLNLTNEQPYSPKRSNCPQQAHPQQGKPPSGHSSPTDSESVFTDDEWTQPTAAADTVERRARPSDSSVENEQIGWTYSQRFSKVNEVNPPPPRPPKRISLVLEGNDKSKDQGSSDTENASPATIGPHDSTSFVEMSYDIPRSHQPPYFSSQQNIDNGSVFSQNMSLISSTPNLIGATGDSMSRQNFYSNAAPTTMDGNVFRYDFFDGPAPAVNRGLKPKAGGDVLRQSNWNGSLKHGMIPGAPTVDRKLKPATPRLGIDTNSLKRKGPTSLTLPEVDAEDKQCLDDSMISDQFFGVSPKTPNKLEDRLQYLDLDHSSSPQKSLGSIPSTSLASTMASFDTALNSSFREKDVAYTTVDFVKTDAFNRVREDSEMTRASKSRLKN